MKANRKIVRVNLSEEDLTDIINALWRAHNFYYIEPAKNKHLISEDECRVFRRKGNRMLKLINTLASQAKNQGFRLKGIK